MFTWYQTKELFNKYGVNSTEHQKITFNNTRTYVVLLGK